jgi:hypothetical protein
MAEKRESNVLSITSDAGTLGLSEKGLSIHLNVDCSEALTGLKAVTREAKKATAALKELEEQQKKNKEEITITVDGNEVAKAISKSQMAKGVRWNEL